ncbi:MAG TPA: RnfABCDGE type electron transport complex subunit D [Dictyoglomaceae bacterium]|nr:RnfABCDGE type electron transport complex subunit D [Dictyoglomaceae bacterium]HOL38727.1 RnfABCDGE type electron transport complex subunit D [Dictyoglomaceae bacterium]HOP94569.1 RnfABCDGE type electron transport complex subunit D [Dictyoglomaceae bacterium]HPP15524.1 RnfABCDGE type electron transport complex subunit D [Dictyoglomaceae bacterium]HPU42839.1 RnfABCDGE type electron transport complex subunit D [Dictyoglomaceae bacterium]
MKLDTKLIVSSSPHIFEGEDVSYAMRQVIYALIPTTLAGIYFFGTHSLLVIIVSIVSAVAWEAISLLIRRKSLSALSDFSAVVTGLLLALTLPPKVPLWIPIVGTAVAIILVKQIFGGLGNNFLNPALVGRAFLLISYPVIMTSWVNPIRTIGNELTSTATSLASTATPIVSTATPLAIDKLKISGYNLPSYFHLCIGDIPGCIGETSVLLLLLGGLWLIYKKVIDWKIPFSFILTVFVISILFGKDPLFQILAGGIFLGAFFMATDWVTTPLTSKGRIIFGIGAGFLTMMIRIFGAYPEGVSYGILVMNALTPLIDRSFKPRKFGEVKK